MAYYLIESEKKISKSKLKKIETALVEAAKKEGIDLKLGEHLYSYHLKTESCDDYYETSTKDLDAIGFMKEFVPWEYECWHKDLGEDESDDDIPYCDFHKELVL